MATAYEKTVYPKSLDFFKEVRDGFNSENKINSELVNKLQRAIGAIQSHTKYTSKTSTATGIIAYSANNSKVYKNSDSHYITNVNVSIPSNIADIYFNGTPFNRRWAVFVSSMGYKKTRSGYTYFNTLCTLTNALNENGNTCQVAVVKEAKWDKGDIVEVTVTIVRPV